MEKYSYHSNFMQLSPSFISSALRIAHGISDGAREIALKSWRRSFAIESKSDGSLVSSIDQAVETLVRDTVAREMPEAGVLGEEYGHFRPDAELQWVVDPIDGTADFVHGLPTFGTVLGLFLNKEPLVGVLDFPALAERYSASKGGGAHCNGAPIKSSARWPGGRIIALPPLKSITRSGIPATPLFDVMQRYPDYRTFWTCYSQAIASSGALDASLELNLKLWDIAAGQILAEESGQAFRWLVPPEPWASGRCSAIIGAPPIVEELASVLGGRLVAA